MESEGERTYRTAYSILLNQRLGGEVVDQTHLEESLQQQDFNMALFLSQKGETSKPRERKPGNSGRTSIEEVEDESWAEYLVKPKSPTHILEEISVAEITAHTATTEESIQPNFRSPSSKSPETEVPIEFLPDPPAVESRVKLNKRRYSPAGAPVAVTFIYE